MGVGPHSVVVRWWERVAARESPSSAGDVRPSPVLSRGPHDHVRGCRRVRRGPLRVTERSILPSAGPQTPVSLKKIFFEPLFSDPSDSGWVDSSRVGTTGSHLESSGLIRSISPPEYSDVNTARFQVTGSLLAFSCVEDAPFAICGQSSFFFNVS